MIRWPAACCSCLVISSRCSPYSRHCHVLQMCTRLHLFYHWRCLHDTIQTYIKRTQFCNKDVLIIRQLYRKFGGTYMYLYVCTSDTSESRLRQGCQLHQMVIGQTLATNLFFFLSFLRFPYWQLNNNKLDHATLLVSCLEKSKQGSWCKKCTRKEPDEWWFTQVYVTQRNIWWIAASLNCALHTSREVINSLCMYVASLSLSLSLTLSLNSPFPFLSLSPSTSL